MKRIVISCVIFLVLASCNSNSSNEQSGETTTTQNDSVGLTNPITIDTVKHPSGMENSNVISTDTAAMNTQNSINKAKSLQRKEK